MEVGQWMLLQHLCSAVGVLLSEQLLSWEVSQPPPYAQKCQPAPVVSCQEQLEATTHHGSEFENQIF